jgi:light-regulated signal transduction histidine kinase (bacteriophytochrome)
VQLTRFQSYALAFFSVVIASGIALLMDHLGIHRADLSPFLVAIAITAWFAGPGPAAVAVVFSFVCFDFYFTEPRYSLRVAATDLPYLIVFISFAPLVAWFSVVRRRIERELYQARDELEIEVEEKSRLLREIRALNEKLEQHADALESSNKELEAFAYSISHDLRAPLRHVAGFAELLRKSAGSSLNEKNARYVNMIVDAANRMGSLIDDLLAFSRISRTEAHNTPVSLDQLVQEAVAEVRQDAGGRNIVFRIDPLPAWYGDRVMLRQALVNLIANAVKFTRTRPQAEIEIGCTEQKNDQVVLFVRDNGVGFDMKYSNKLFGVFQRLHSQEEFEGTGIGLATVQRVIHRHGGQVWAEGKVDGGATFHFSLSKTMGS